MLTPHHEIHLSHRAGWLRAAVLGANDGIISVASLMVGVAASGSSGNTLLVTGIAGLVAGAVSMAAGEYVSVQSQADTEKADLLKEMLELNRNPEFELNELKQIYIERGLPPELALEVAKQLSQHDALHAHARDEIGISHLNTARPVQAALASAASFTVGAVFPILAMAWSPNDMGQLAVFVVTCITLLLLGGLASYAGGACMARGALRVLSWGLLAMLCTHLAGSWFGSPV